MPAISVRDDPKFTKWWKTFPLKMQKNNELMMVAHTTWQKAMESNKKAKESSKKAICCPNCGRSLGIKVIIT